MPVTTSGGCIRLYDTGPEWHENSTHVTVGLNTSTPPTITPGGDLEFRLLQSRPVVTTSADPDETLVQRGVSAGISGGVSTCIVRFHHKTEGRLYLTDPADYALISGPQSNLWVRVDSLAPDPDPEPEPEPEPDPEPEPEPIPDPCRVTYADVESFFASITRHDLERLSLQLRTGCLCIPPAAT